MGAKAKLCVVLFAIVGLTTATASAELLGTGLAYNDGTRTWEGSATFTKAVTAGTLQGEVDWAIFTASNFSTLFPDYTPTPGELVYAYQIFNTGSVEISKGEAPLLSNAPADTVGDFTSNGMGGTIPNAMSIIPADVIWDFTSNDIPDPGNSSGLVFSSPRAPRIDWYVVIDGGGTVNVNGIGGPGTVNIPEPSALALLAAAAAALGIGTVWRRNKTQ